MKNKRKFKGNDAKMVERARIIYHQLLKDIEVFNAFSSKIDLSFAQAFLVKIELADKVLADQEVISQQVTKTNLKLKCLKEARHVYQKAKSYAILSFGVNNSLIANEFSKGYKDAFYNVPKMISFLETLYETLMRHQNQMQSAETGGMPNTFPLEIKVKCEQLTQLYVDQETAKRLRITATANRINTLNACYEDFAMINNIAKIVFANSPAHKNIYCYSALFDNNKPPH